LILSGLAVAVAFKCSSFNIGVEGQLMVGALCSALVGVYVPLPSGIHLIVTLLAGIAGGMAFAFLPAILKSRCNVSVIISTILLNYIAQFFVQFCVMGPFHGNTSAQATLAIRKTAELPSITSKPYQLNLGFILMVVVVVLVYVLLNKTTRGYEMNAVGLNSIASEIQGINAERNMFLALVISGGIAGLAGGVEVTGTLHKMVNGFSTGYGFAGIPIALMARCNPFAILLTGFFFGLMKSGSFLMQSTVGVSSDMVGIIQGLVVAFLCTENVLRYYLERERG
jgi:simple sugar transport system permease protein